MTAYTAARSRILLALLLVSWALGVRAQNVRIIFLVRHAEKVSSAPHALLNAAGHARAECLARTLGEAGVQAIYVTDVRRVQQTAEPLAEQLKLAPIVTPKADIAGLVAKIRDANTTPVLVVAHQDTLPKLVALLGGGNIAPIEDNEFDSMFILTLEGRGTRLVKLRYCMGGGAASQTDQGMKAH